MFGSGHLCMSVLRSFNLCLRMTTLTISNEEISDIMKIVKSLEESVLLTKGVSETIKNEAKGQKSRFLGMLLGTLDVSLLGNQLTGEGTIRACEGRVRVVQDF